MKNYTKATIAASLFLLMLALSGGCTNARNIRPAQGTPKRIVSLTPNNTEILFALGVGSHVVGVTNACNYPPEVKNLPKVGDTTISIEKVAALKPDLVVAHKLLNGSAIKRLKELGFRVIATNPETIAQVECAIKEIGAQVGTPQKAAHIAELMQRTFEETKKRYSGKQQINVLVVVQASPLWTAGPGTFVDEMLAALNCKNAASDAKPGFSTFSVESAAARNPDVIIVTREEDKLFFTKSEIWKHTKAVKGGKVVVVNPDLIFRAGPRLALGLAELERAIRAK